MSTLLSREAGSQKWGIAPTAEMANGSSCRNLHAQQRGRQLKVSLQERRWLIHMVPQEERAWRQQLPHLLGARFSS